MKHYLIYTLKQYGFCILIIGVCLSGIQSPANWGINFTDRKNSSEYLVSSDGFIGGPYEQMNDTRFGVAHAEMIIDPAQWATGLYEDKDDPYWHQSAIMMRDAGASWNRFEFAWDAIQPNEYTWDWSDLDTYMDFSDYYGLRILPILAYGNAWACEGGDRLAPITNMSAWRLYINQTVLRYKDRPSLDHWWQIWNEPNIEPFFHGDFVNDFLPIMVAAAEEIRSVDPSAKILACALTGDDMEELVSTMVNRIGKDLFNQLFDGVDIHPYAGNIIDVTRKIQGAINALKDWYTGELWITEVGWAVNPAIDGYGAEVEKAENIAKVLVQSRSMNVTHTIIHMWCDWGWLNGVPKVQNATWGENWFGIVDLWNNPKPSYFAFKQVSNLIGCANYSGSIQLNGFSYGRDIVSHLYSYETEETTYYTAILWNNMQTSDSITLQTSKSGDFVVYNATGSILNNIKHSNSVSIELTDKMQIIVFNTTTSMKLSDFSVNYGFNSTTFVLLVFIPGFSIAVIVYVLWKNKKVKN